MANRIQVDGSIMDPQPLQVNIRPVDTYFRPGEGAVAPPDQGSKLQTLGRALSSLSPAVTKYTNQHFEQDKQKAAATAQILAQKNQGDWNTFLAKPGNEQYRKANPWLKVYYEQAVLKNLSQDLDKQARINWSTSPERESDDALAFNQFWDKQQETFNDKLSSFAPRNVAEAFLPEVYKSRQALENEHINYRQKARLENAEAAFDKTQLNNTRNYIVSYAFKRSEFAAELDKDKSLTDAARTVKVNAFRSDFIKQTVPVYEQEIAKAAQLGLSKERAKLKTAEAIIATAVEQGDMQVLDLLDHVKVDGQSLNEISTDIKEKRATAKQRIFSDHVQKEDYAYKVSQRANDELGRKHLSDGFAALYNSHDADLTSDIEMLNNIGKTDDAIALMKLQRSLQEQDAQPIVDNAKAINLINRSYAPDFTPSEAVGAVGAVGLTNAKTALDNYNYLKQNGKRYDGTFREAFEARQSALKEALKPRWSSQKSKQNEAVAGSLKEFQEWAKGHPDATEYEQLDAYDIIADKWEKRYGSKSSGVTLKSQPGAPTRTPKANPQAKQTAKPDPKTVKRLELEKRIMSDSRLSKQKKDELIKQLRSR